MIGSTVFDLELLKIESQLSQNKTVQLMKPSATFCILAKMCV
jgi:hypothetical protein